MVVIKDREGAILAIIEFNGDQIEENGTDMGVGEILLSNSEGSIQRLFGRSIVGLVEIVTSFVIIKTG